MVRGNWGFPELGVWGLALIPSCERLLGPRVSEVIPPPGWGQVGGRPSLYPLPRTSLSLPGAGWGRLPRNTLDLGTAMSRIPNTDAVLTLIPVLAPNNSIPPSFFGIAKLLIDKKQKCWLKQKTKSSWKPSSCHPQHNGVFWKQSEKAADYPGLRRLWTERLTEVVCRCSAAASVGSFPTDPLIP